MTTLSLRSIQRKVSNGVIGLPAAGSSLDRHKIAACPAVSAIEQRASMAAEMQALGPSCISSTPQLNREYSLSRNLAWIPCNSVRPFKGNICADIFEFESSLSGRVGVKRFQTAPSILVLISLAGILASLRDRRSGPPMMGSEGCEDQSHDTSLP